MPAFSIIMSTHLDAVEFFRQADYAEHVIARQVKISINVIFLGPAVECRGRVPRIHFFVDFFFRLFMVEGKTLIVAGA